MASRFTARLVINAIEGAVLIVLIVAACYVSIGRILVSRIENFHDDIEAMLSQALNVDVSIEKMSGGWSYLDPEVTIERLVIGDSDRPAINIEHVSARLDSMASLVEGSAVVRNLEIDGLTLSLQQDEDGTWHIEGLPRSGRSFNPDPLLNSIPYLQGVNISKVNVDVKGQQNFYHIENQAGSPFELMGEFGRRTVSMPLVIAQRGSRISSEFELLGRYSGDPRRAESFSANLYLRLPEIDLADFLKPVAEGFNLAKADLRGQFWLECDEGRFVIRALPAITQLEVVNGGKRVTVLENFSTELEVQARSLDEWQVGISRLETRVGSLDWNLPALKLALQRRETGWDWGVYVPRLDITSARRVATEIGGSTGLLDDAAIEAIGQLAPEGELANILVSSRFAAGKRNLQVAAGLDDIKVESWGGAPAISSLNGFVWITPGHGYIDIRNDEFSIDIASMFAEPWSLDSAQARLHFNYSPEHFRLYSDLMHLTVGSVTASGRVELNVPADLRKRTWGLEIGIRNADLLEAHQYLPKTLPEGLVAWLNRAIQGGQARETGLLFHGGLGKQAPRISKVYELFFKVNDAVLDYDAKWPNVNDLSATIYVGNRGVFSDDARGTVYDSAVTDGRIRVPMSFSVPPNAVLIDADVQGPLADGIRIMTETPVAETTNHMAKGWVSDGNMSGHLKLDIPLGTRAGEPTGVDVNLNLSGEDIFMSQYDLDVGDIDGAFRYRNDAGLSAEKFTAVLFGQPVSGRIESEATGDGGAVEVFVGGKVDIKDLYAWSKQTLLTRMSGLTVYDARLHLPFGNRAAELGYVETRSDLAGIGIDLPAPMKKAAAEQTHFTYRQSFLEPGYRIDLELGDLTRASLKVDDGIVKGGRLRFGPEPLGAVAYDKVKVSGELDFVDYAEWEAVTRFLEDRSEVSLESEVARKLDSIDVHVKSMRAFGVELDDVDTHITRGTAAWNVHLENGTLSGLITVPDADEQPLDVALDYLRFVSDEDHPDSDPLSDMNPVEFKAVDFRTAKLALDNEDYGSWQFRFRPQASGAILDGLTAEVKGLSVVDDSKVTWTVAEGKQRSSFEGTVKVADLASALKQWGFASSIEGQGFHFDANIGWPGSPAMIDLGTITGLVHLREGKGRFVQADTGGALKLLGIFDFASLARRFRFDFSDVVDKGLSFSEIRGSTRLDRGIVHVVDPIVIVGSGSTFKVGGSINLKTNALDNDMIVTLPVNRNLPWYAAYSAIATGPLAGAGVWLAQKVFQSQIDQMSSAKYKITGTIDEPDIEFVTIFNDRVRETSAEPSEAPEETVNTDIGTPGE